ncbi:phosphoadenosine phosphosulfate reductase [Jannaschia sp. S6380]|uniref:phosphoadenosine phosphosulfate reductase n=1 Tax=Jannaschia sp. S6380 TaxID=2926408 RepID=UPI001FF620E5|nr:phosphoadenosine phosphosulfate reductase [Jannaschia sp. S6380]MCK0166325.1 phosphoadenosine phosphosulfate reductase [Jannaschia sp. S6380]
MNRARHRDALLAEAGDDGTLRQLGDDHLALHRPRRDAGTLLVTFEGLDETRLRDGGLPFSSRIAAERGWATLDIMAEGRTWFRDAAVHDLFDDLTDDGFFDEYDRVVFAGAGMGAYGAGAHSVASPGAIVLLIQPIATLDRVVAPWERRFRSARALDWTGRYGNAARMVDAAERVFLVTDPHVAGDAMHASLFSASHVVRLPAPFAGADIRGRLESIGILDRLLTGAETGALGPEEFARLWRGRRQDAGWLQDLLRRTDRMDRPWLQALVAGHMVRHGAGQVARRRLNAALSRLASEGRDAPGDLAPAAPSGRTLMAGE